MMTREPTSTAELSSFDPFSYTGLPSHYDGIVDCDGRPRPACAELAEFLRKAGPDGLASIFPTRPS
jgi:hypothetical protein